MKTNVKKILFGDGRHRRSPVLLAVTPPRTGERTLLGVENLLQSIAVPEPFSLELAGDSGGVTLLARCQDRQVVQGQLAAHYPQARIREVAPEDDPLRLADGEQAWGITLRRYPRRDAGGVAVGVGVAAAADAAGLETQAPAGPEPPPGSARVVRSRWRDAGPNWPQGHSSQPRRRPNEPERRPSRSYPACSAAGAKSRASAPTSVGDAPSPCSSTNFILLRNGPANWLSPACRSVLAQLRLRHG